MNRLFIFKYLLKLKKYVQIIVEINSLCLNTSLVHDHCSANVLWACVDQRRSYVLVCGVSWPHNLLENKPKNTVHLLFILKEKNSKNTIDPTDTFHWPRRWCWLPAPVFASLHLWLDWAWLGKCRGNSMLCMLFYSLHVDWLR